MSTPGLLSSASPSIEEVRFSFDLNGFVILPAVLSQRACDSILAEVRESIRYREAAVASGDAALATAFAPGITRQHPNVNELKHHSESRGYASYHSWLSFAGQSGALLDHPTLVPILNELVGESSPSNDSSYSFRCDDSMTIWREAGFTAAEATQSPHGGGGQRARALGYRAQGGTIFSGATRVVWELTGVPTETCGGTLVLPGSHKAEFDFPASVKQPGNAHMRSYACPPGSLVIFTGKAKLYYTYLPSCPSRVRLPRRSSLARTITPQKACCTRLRTGHTLQYRVSPSSTITAMSARSCTGWRCRTRRSCRCRRAGERCSVARGPVRTNALACEQHACV